MGPAVYAFLVLACRDAREVGIATGAQNLPCPSGTVLRDVESRSGREQWCECGTDMDGPYRRYDPERLRWVVPPLRLLSINLSGHRSRVRAKGL